MSSKLKAKNARKADPSSREPGSKHRVVKKTRAPEILTLFPDHRKRTFKLGAETRASEYIKELREAYLHVGLALYVGAGVSRSIGLPSWSELIRALTLTMMMRRVGAQFEASGNMSDESNWQAIAKIQEDVAKMADYDRPMLMMARAIKDELKDELPSAIIRVFYTHMRHSRRATRGRAFVLRDPSRTKRLLLLSPLLKALVCLARSERDTRGVQAIVNYNYDDTLDAALARDNVRCVTVKSGKDRVPRGALPCYHVHGVLPLRASERFNLPKRSPQYGNFVFSEDEYHAEYSDPYRWSNMTQVSLLGRYIGLFVGLSLEDPNIRRLVDVTHKQYPEGHNYAILPRKRSLAMSKDSKATVLRNLFEQVETTPFEKIGIRVIWVNSYDEIPCVLHEISTGNRITVSESLRLYGNR